ncbi:MAG: RNA 2',3'-cyclic phosphodiesterase [Candidatus Nanohaloarchaea archaeon]
MSNQTLKDYMARVFSAVDINEKELLDELEQLRDRLDLGFKPVPREKMHITLEFFEDAGEEEIEELKAAMQEVDVEPFELEITGVGAFPSEDYIRVVWAGAEHEKLHELYSEVSDHSLESSNDHDFTPHITLMRVENVTGEDKRKLRKMLREHRHHRFDRTCRVEKVTLFESQLTGNGSRYTRLYEEEL